MGAAIRHAGELLKTNAGTPNRLLLVLSDGLPYDDGYESRYAEADARKALEELRSDGAGCLCLSIGTSTSPHPRALGRSHPDDGRFDPPSPQENPEIGLVAGEDRPVRGNQERDVGVDEIARAIGPEQLADSPGGNLVKSRDVESWEDSGEIGLPSSIAPHLCHHPGGRMNRHPVALEDPQHRSDRPVTLVDCDQCARVEDRRHAVPRRREARSAAAAASSSSSLKAPSSDSH